MTTQGVIRPKQTGSLLSLRYETTFCVVMAASAFLWRDNPNLVYPQILQLLLMLLGLNLGAGLVLRMSRRISWVSSLFILGNLGLITAILPYSGGLNSSLWVLYLMPISSSCLLLEGGAVAWVVIGSTVIHALYVLPADAACNGGHVFEISVKAGLFALTGAMTWSIAQRERSAQEELGQTREQILRLELRPQSPEGSTHQNDVLIETKRGMISRGLAHDLRNALTISLGFSNVLLKDHVLSEEARRDVEIIRNSTIKAASLTDRIGGEIAGHVKVKT